MEHKYELLRKCHGLRFRATLCDKKEEGIIKVGEDGITLCYGAKDPGRMFIFERTKTLSFTEQTFGFLPNDFEIVPRDPETYHDWQVGDKISRNDDVCTVVLRCGEVVLYKYEGADGSRCCTCPYICEELFRDGCRLVLTDIEKQIIDEKKKYEPQDGDICYVESRKGYKSIFIYKAKSEPESESESKSESNRTSYYVSYGGKELERVLGIAKLDVQCMVMVNNDIKFLRPATDDEKQKLFDAMAKKGKRWNAEKKVVESIQEPEELRAVKSEIKSEIKSGHQFKKAEPVLVRDNGCIWKIGMFTKMRADYFKYGATTNGLDECGYHQCIPYNERTMHLLGTTEDYKEEQS